MIPTNLLCPEDRPREIDDWIETATREMDPDEGKEELFTLLPRSYAPCSEK